MELLLQLLQGEEVVGVAESLAAQDEGGVVELKPNKLLNLLTMLNVD